jgi:hypothetical protein
MLFNPGFCKYITCIKNGKIIHRMLRRVTERCRVLTEMSKKVPVNIQKPVPGEIWAILVWLLQQMVCVVPVHFNTISGSSSQTSAKTAESSWLHSNFLTGILCSLLECLLSHWSALTTPKSSGVPESNVQRIRVKGIVQSVDWALASYPLLTESLVLVLPDNVENM